MLIKILKLEDYSLLPLLRTVSLVNVVKESFVLYKVPFMCEISYLTICGFSVECGDSFEGGIYSPWLRKLRRPLGGH